MAHDQRQNRGDRGAWRRSVILALALVATAITSGAALPANAQAAAPGTSGPAGTGASAQSDLWGGIRRFAAQLSADNQVTLTHSDATASVDMVFDIATKTLTWEITHRGLTSTPTAVRLHGPAQAGTNGAALIDLGESGLNSPIRGKATVTAALVQYLLLGWTYVSIATVRYPDGEIRGKVDVVPPANYRRWRPAARAGQPRGDRAAQGVP